jgi:alpha-galactosidase
MKITSALIVLAFLSAFESAHSQEIWLDQLNLSAMDAGWGSPNVDKSVEGNPLSIGGQKFQRGVGTHAISHMRLDLDGKANRFTALVGVDDEAGERASIEFFVLGDRKVLWQSGVMKKGEAPKMADVNLSNIRTLGLLVSNAGDGSDWDHADWCEAKFTNDGSVTAADFTKSSLATSTERDILTPRPSDKPQINGAKVFGVRPGHPFLFTIAATGQRPMTFSVTGLPQGLALDGTSGRITGEVTNAGEYNVVLKAKNGLGSAEREFKIVVGPNICLTPPMGWNSWNCWACAVDDQKVRAAADAFVKTGLMNHGWTYINIDDCWQVQPDSKDPILGGEQRDKNEMINTNKKFPDMKSLGNYVHGEGLKLGIYSSPGPQTCAGYTGSYRYEQQDAERYAAWGVDYLKYDWCSYGTIAPKPSLDDLKKPYEVMRAALNNVNRDIVFSLCQYGMGNVWEWGGEVGGNCWRTTGDISDSWGSMATIGFSQAGHEKYAKPGNWNDPDMLVVGLVGWGPNLHPSNLKPNEQYTHISLWCLLSAPLLIGCDLSKIDDFTMNLLTNDEVLAVDQDPLGKQAGRVSKGNGEEVWSKQLEDGSTAVGMFFVGEDTDDPVKSFPWEDKTSSTITVKASDVDIRGKFNVRDLWRQKDLGTFENTFAADVPYHGVLLVKLTPVK